MTIKSLAIAALALATATATAQQPSAKRNFEAEIQASLASAKSAAGFDFLGTLVRTCLIPQSGGEDTSNEPAFYITNPSKAPARDSWYTEPAKVSSIGI